MKRKRKMKHRMLSLAAAVLLIIHSIPIYATTGDVKIELGLTGEISNIDTDKEYDGQAAAPFRFHDGILDGVDPGDDVYLVADQEFESKDVKNQQLQDVTLRNFRLEGDDEGKYELPADISEPILKKARITPRRILIAPKKPYIYYGQDKPTEITEITYDTERIVSGDTVNIHARLRVQNGNEVGDYNITTISINCDNPNFEAKLDGDVKFGVREFVTAATAASDNDTGEYFGVDKAVLTAPENFLISKGNRLGDSGWSKSITIDLSETQTGKASYYLRNNDEDDKEYYRAISNLITYNYKSVQTLPEIVSTKVEKADSNTTLNFLNNGVFSNGSVKVVVSAKGSFIEQDTTIYLGESGEYGSQTATSELKDGIYYYTAAFEFDVPSDSDYYLTKHLKAYAENSSGKGITVDVKFTDEKGNIRNTNRLVLDNINPDVSIININGNYKWSIKADVAISDTESGIAKVEYMWDTGFRINNRLITDFVEYNDYSSNKTNYEFVLWWINSIEVPKNQHTLHLRVTDYAGNVFDSSVKDEIGSDMRAPNITSVEIRKSQSNLVDSILRFLDFGNFSNEAVDIVVTADDNEDVIDEPATGVDSVFLNDREMTKNEDGEYVLTVLANDKMSVMQITVTDKAENSTTAAVNADFPDGEELIKSDSLIVEKDAPTIDFDFSVDGHPDKEGNVWYGENDKPQTVTVTASDHMGSVQSGLYSIEITDNGTSIFSKRDFTAIELEQSKSFVMGDFTEGRHELTVTVEDNAGNTYKDTKEFYMDYSSPDGVIAVKSPQSVSINGKQWFDKDERIEFRVDASDTGSGLDNISLKINSQAFHFSRDQIKSDADGYYVIVDTNNLNPDSEQKYTVTGSMTDIAKNSFTLAALTVYKDFENPTIHKFTVEKKNEIRDTVLNVLSFGTFSNDSLLFKAYVSDAAYDSGIDYVTVIYDGLTEPRHMADEGNGVFSVDIPIGAETFQSDIVVTAYDAYGKRSITCPNIENADPDKGVSNGVFVMMETLQPVISISMPAGDGVTRSDGQTWYNSKKNIVLTVQDENSGIRNIEWKVNGLHIAADRNNALLLKTQATESAMNRDTGEHKYTFDTDYFTSIVGEPTNGKYVMDVEVTDQAGNVTTGKAEYYMDKVAPTIDKIEFSPEAADGVRQTSDFVKTLEYGYYFKKKVTLSVHVSDLSPSSGIHEVKYRFVPYQDGKKQEETTGVQKVVKGVAKLNVPKGFKGQIFVQVLDNAGNRSGEKTTKSYVVDNRMPEIHITNHKTTDYQDANNNKLYVSNNRFTVTITDAVSGIYEIGYSKDAEIESYDRKTILLDNTGYKVGDKLGDGWTVSEMDSNLVTKVSRTFSFRSDDNDVILTFDATDRSGNKKEKVRSEKFTIDKTAPIINVAFRQDEGSGQYYNANRIADITVIERNFDPDKIRAVIENRFGRVPAIQFTERSKTEHVAQVDFDEGDYTFDIDGADQGNHAATVNLSGGNEEAFYVDKTQPSIDENFISFSNGATEDSFHKDQTATIKVTEHNFDPELVNLRITRKGAGEDHNGTGLEDVTAEFLGEAQWASEGDVHTISLPFHKDAVYQVEINPSDMAGNVSEHRNTAIFEIDKTAPKLIKPTDRTADVYVEPAADEPSKTITFHDDNSKEISYHITAYNFNKKDNGAYELALEKEVKSNVSGETVDLPEEYFEKDGTYEVKATAYDVAGNDSGEKAYTYVVMRNTAMMAYIPEDNLATFNNVGTRAIDFPDIPINVYVANGSGFTLKIGETLLGATDYVIIEEKEIINQVKEYKVSIPRTFISSMFNDNNQVYDLPINVLNDSGQIITLGRMIIDNVKPFGEFESGFVNGKGYYGVDRKDVQIIKLSDDIDETNTRVRVNGNVVPYTHDTDNKTMAFTLEKSKTYGHPWAGHDVKVTLVDTAGNEYSLAEIKDVYVGDWFLRYWVFFAVGGVTIMVVALFIWKPWKKKTT